MVAPLLVAGVIGAGATSSVITGLIIDRLTGHKTTQRDIVYYSAHGVIPGAGYVGAIGKGLMRVKTNKRIYTAYTSGRGMYGKYLNPAFTKSMVVRFGSKAEAKRALVADSVLYGGGLIASVKGYEIGVNYALDKIYNNKSRGRGQSLTSELMTPRQTQTKRSNASAGKRTLSPRLSKGDKVNGRARRKTSYCNLHKKYDFCEYYNK